MATTSAPCVIACEAKLRGARAMTSQPGLKCVTFEPILVIRPAHSIPSVSRDQRLPSMSRGGNRPVAFITSLKFRAVA